MQPLNCSRGAGPQRGSEGAEAGWLGVTQVEAVRRFLVGAGNMILSDVSSLVMLMRTGEKENRDVPNNKLHP